MLKRTPTNEYMDTLTQTPYKFVKGWNFVEGEMTPAQAPTVEEWQELAHALRNARIAELEVMRDSTRQDLIEAITENNKQLEQKARALLKAINAERQALLRAEERGEGDV